MMELRINPIVAEDLKNIKEYIAADNEEMATKTMKEIYGHIEYTAVSVCGSGTVQKDQLPNGLSVNP